jgi:competence protein ComFC
VALTARLQRITEAALDLLFPPQCAGCGAPGHELCPRCAQSVEPVPAAICARCGRPQPVAVSLCPDCRTGQTALASTRAAALHTAPLREAIHAFKYQDRPHLAQPLGRYLVAAFQREPWLSLSPAIDAVVPAPLHADRLRERGYNQSELLAAVLCRACGLALEPVWIQRVRATRQQVGLSPAERKHNVAGAFVADPAVRGRTLLVVDDVYTTGATLESCADAALASGARTVYALTLAIPART